MQANQELKREKQTLKYFPFFKYSSVAADKTANPLSNLIYD